MTAQLLVLLKILVTVMVIAIGMRATVSDLTCLWRQPRLLIRSVIAMYLLVPLFALFLIVAFPVSSTIKVALLVIAISAGAPLLPRKLMGFDDDAYVFSLVVISSVLAVVAVPVWHAALSAVYHISTDLAAFEIARLIATTVLAPLALGMLLRWLIPWVNESLSDLILKTAGLILVLAGATLLVTHWKILAEAGWPFIGALAVMTFGALVIGHLTGGPDPADRAVLAVTCTTRHLGITILVAASLPGPRTAVLIAAYLTVSALVTIPYLQWQKRVVARSNESGARS